MGGPKIACKKARAESSAIQTTATKPKKGGNHDGQNTNKKRYNTE